MITLSETPSLSKKKPAIAINARSSGNKENIA
jgi:hypothetical protein